MTLCLLPKTEPAGDASQLTAFQPTVDGGDDDDKDDDDDGFLLVFLKLNKHRNHTLYVFQNHIFVVSLAVHRLSLRACYEEVSWLRQGVSFQF